MYEGMQAGKVDFLRTDFHWALIERNGKYDFSIYDEIVDGAAKRGLKILAILTWQGSGNRLALDYPKEYTAFVKATVEHFKDRVKYWEVWNEHDWFYQVDGKVISGKKYGDGLKMAYKAIKQANKDAVVLYGGLAFIERSEAYIEQSLEDGGFNAFDIMNFHVYPAPNPPENRLKKVVDFLNAKMQKHGKPKPIWITETGSSTPMTVGESTKIIQEAIKNIGQKFKVIYAVETSDVLQNTGIGAIVPNAKLKFIKYEKIKTLPKKALLFLPAGEAFNYTYIDDVANFVCDGGTIINIGGYPFHHDVSGKTMLKKGLEKIRADIIPNWEVNPKMPGVFREKPIKAIGNVASLQVSELPKVRGFNFTAKNLQQGDEMIPLMTFKWKDTEFSPAVLYKYNSDFKGNAILIASNDMVFVTEQQQAAFLARSFIYGFSIGLQKIFNYCFRAKPSADCDYERNFGIIRSDFSEKPSFRAYKTASLLLGNSVRPKVIEKDDNVVLARWRNPQGEAVSAVWIKNKKKDFLVQLNKKGMRVLDVQGNILAECKDIKNKPEILKYTATISPIYVVGGDEKSIGFVK